MSLALRWLWTAAILFAALGITAAAIQLVVIGVLDITSGRLATFAAIAAFQGFAVALLLKKLDGGVR